YSHQLKEDGSLDESPKATKQIATNQLDDNINIISVLWRRFPTSHTLYPRDLTYLKIERVNGRLKFDHPSLGRGWKTIDSWVGDYWYKVLPGLTHRGPQVLEFKEQKFSSVRYLGSNGGVSNDPGAVIRNFGGNRDPHFIGGQYFLLPSRAKPGPYHDVMTAEDDITTGKRTFTVIRHRFLEPEQQHSS
ncbi:hypothetical protein AX14_008878, partial [Amanita brunnescens Koide BX004]